MQTRLSDFPVGIQFPRGGQDVCDFFPLAPRPSPLAADARAPTGTQPGRLEIRLLDSLAVTPSQVGFPGAQLAARLATRTKRNGKGCREIVYLLSSLTLAQLQAHGMLALKRGYWVIESRRHHCLDITLGEDQSRVRHPTAARVLGTIRRVVVSLANAAVDRDRRCHPKTKCNTSDFQQRFCAARGGRERLHALIHANFPQGAGLMKLAGRVLRKAVGGRIGLPTGRGPA